MAQYLLTLEISLEPLAIEQVLQVVRYRGFRVTDITVAETQNHYTMAISVFSETSIRNLMQQLNKLYDVTSLTSEMISSLEKSA